MIFVSVSVFFSKLGVCRVPRGFGALGFGHVPGRRRRTRPRSATPCVARGPASPPDFFGMGSTVRLGTQPIPVIFLGLIFWERLMGGLHEFLDHFWIFGRKCFSPSNLRRDLRGAALPGTLVVWEDLRPGVHHVWAPMIWPVARISNSLSSCNRT